MIIVNMETVPIATHLEEIILDEHFDFDYGKNCKISMRELMKIHHDNPMLAKMTSEFAKEVSGNALSFIPFLAVLVCCDVVLNVYDIPSAYMIIVATKSISEMIPPKNYFLVKIHLKKIDKNNGLYIFVFLNKDFPGVYYVLNAQLLPSLFKYKRFLTNNPRIAYDISRIISAEKNLDKISDDMISILNRECYTNFFGWTTPKIDALNLIKKFVGKCQVLEICSGLGFWSFLLKYLGVNIVSTSLFQEEQFPGHKFASKCNIMPISELWWTRVDELDYLQAITKYISAGCLFIVYGNSCDVNVNKIIREFRGNKIIVITESCDDELFNLSDDFVSYQGPKYNSGQQFDLVHTCKIPTITKTLSNVVYFYARH